MMGITMSDISTQELLTIVKDSFEEQKDIKILSLYVEGKYIHGMYILPLQQSLSFTHEPLLDMTTDIDGYTIIMEELGQVLLYAYNAGAIDYYLKLIHESDIVIPNKTFDNLLNICIDNPPLQRIDARLIDWFNITQEVHKVRTKSFLKVCAQYNKLDSIDIDSDISVDTHDDAYILLQFEEATKQLQQKKHKKITELTIHNINQLYIQLQVDLYMTDNK